MRRARIADADEVPAHEWTIALERTEEGQPLRAVELEQLRERRGDDVELERLEPEARGDASERRLGADRCEATVARGERALELREVGRWSATALAATRGEDPFEVRRRQAGAAVVGQLQSAQP